MKPKHILTRQFVLLFTFLGLTLSASFAQNDFKLTDYKNPFYNYRALDLEFGLYGNNSINNSSGQNGIFDKNNNNVFTGNLTSRYFSMRNAEFFQQEQSYWINFDGGTQKHTFEFKTPSVREISQKNSGLNLNIGGNSINRFYDSKKRFFELAVTFDGGLANQQSKNEEKGSVNPFKNEIDDNRSLLKASVPLLVGKGRIEEVQAARLAVYILDDLQNSGDLAKTPDKEDILAFSRFITEIKNKRYFDSRLRKISEI
ncbi:MAG: hypothetical protein Q8T08_01795, partial [Ignavibacteria bacterium]|nr:hypothetical protein [Ignavibacteria bacterium]